VYYKISLLLSTYSNDWENFCRKFPCNIPDNLQIILLYHRDYFNQNFSVRLLELTKELVMELFVGWLSN